MDKQLPEDFDPASLIDDPMQNPSEHDDKGNQRGGAQENKPDDAEVLLPMLHVLPSSLKRFLFTGSCCAGVGVLYLLSAWDHNLMPGFKSSFAAASEVKDLKSDVTEMYVWALAKAIRDLSTDNCSAHSTAITEQIDGLQAKYKARTGEKYPHTECPTP